MQKRQQINYFDGCIEVRPLRIDELVDLIARHKSALTAAASLKPLQQGENAELLGLSALLLVGQHIGAIAEIVAVAADQPSAAAEFQQLPPQVLLAALLATATLTFEYLNVSPTEILSGRLPTTAFSEKLH